MPLENKIKKIYFRFDAGGSIGFGHLGRIESISDACASFNIQPIWIVRARTGLNRALFKHKTLWLKETELTLDTDTQKWISNEWVEAQEVLELVENSSWIFIDHYSLYGLFITELKKHGMKTACLLDFLPEKINCDVVVNYNVGVEKELNAYREKKRDSLFLLGPQYAPIKSELKLIQKAFVNNLQVNHVGVYLGGVEYTALVKLLRLLELVSFFKNKKIRWCVNSDEDLRKLKDISTGLEIEFLTRQENLNAFYLWSDLVVGACGVSFLERSYIGLPQILFRVADNQKDVVQFLTEENIAFYVGDLINSDLNDLVFSFEKLKVEDLEALTKKSKSIYDGLGQTRILEKILELEKCC